MSASVPPPGDRKVPRIGAAQGVGAAAPGPGPDQCPIEALHEHHLIQRQLCAEMETLAAINGPRVGLASRVLINLCRDLPLHMADEEESLFPRLRRRAAPEDGLEITLPQLVREHTEARAAFARLVPALAFMAEGRLPAPEDRDALRDLAQAKRRHLIVENAILLPLARLRLRKSDKARMLVEIRARHARSPETCGACQQLLARHIPAPSGESSS